MLKEGALLSGSYDPYLVALSILIAVLASYTALDLASRVTATAGSTRIGWLLGGAFAMGAGIWSMHFIGMLAFSLPTPVYYEFWLVALSLVAAVLASGIALFVVSRPGLGERPFLLGGVLMGLGISAMHYTGMAAMRLEATIRYDLGLVMLSLAIAIGASLFALWVAFSLRAESSALGIVKRIGGATIMGACIPAMHYTGMAAASFVASPEPITLSPLLINVSVLGGVAVASAAFLILGLTLLTSFLDRRFAGQAVALQRANELLQKANERMRRDLDAAARVQQALLPESIPAIEHASFAWVYRPCAELGGDSLNVFKLDERHVGMYVLDVSGHGVPASFLSVTLSRVLIPRHDPSCLFTRADLLAGAGALASPAEVASRLNRMFHTDGEGRQFFTLVYGILDTQGRQFRYVCAGHPPPIHFARGREPLLCEARSLPIGLFEEEQYEESTIALQPGDRVYLYSDGVLEAMNRKREIFDEPRLLSAIESNRPKGLNESVCSILQAVLEWSGTDHVHDDLSLLAVELK